MSQRTSTQPTLDFPAELSNKADMRSEIAFINKGVNCNVLRPLTDR